MSEVHENFSQKYNSQRSVKEQKNLQMKESTVKEKTRGLTNFSHSYKTNNSGSKSGFSKYEAQAKGLITRKILSSQTPHSKSKLKYELLNLNFGNKKRKRFGAASRLNIQTQGLNKKVGHIHTPHHKQMASSSRNIDFVYEKSKRSVRQIYSNMKDYESFNENPKNLLEIRKKLNLTGGYAEALGSGKLKKYGTNNSNHSRQNTNSNLKAKNQTDFGFKPTQGAFLKNPTHVKRQIKIDNHYPSDKKKINFMEDPKDGIDFSSKSQQKVLNSITNMKKKKLKKLKKQLFNQNIKHSTRLGAQKVMSVRGIFSKMGGKYTSSRAIKDQKQLNYDNFQSYYGYHLEEQRATEEQGREFDSNKFEGDFRKGKLENREDMQRFVEYIGEGSKEKKETTLGKHILNSRKITGGVAQPHGNKGFFPNNQ